MHNDDFAGQRGGRRARTPRRLEEPWIAIQGLRFLAADHEAAERFFAMSGLDGTTIRAAAAAPGFARAMLDYLVEDEARLMRFAETSGCHPADVAATHAALAADESWSGEKES